MAQPHSQAQQRPTYPPQSQSFQQTFQQPNGRPQYSPQSPPPGMPYSSPSPQPHFPTNYATQAPPAKRPRLSPEVPSPYSQPVGTPTAQAGSPVNGQMNDVTTPRPSGPSMMPPPQQPFVKSEQDHDGNIFRDSGPMNFDGNGSSFPNATSPSTPQTPVLQGPNIPNVNGTAPRPSESGQLGASAASAENAGALVSAEVSEARERERLDWQEARHSQHELWDPFLYCGTLNQKIKDISHKSNLIEPQSGVLVNTQKNQPPPRVRVNGYEGATKVINNGQSILDTREKAERLNELVKLLSISANSRLKGIIQTAARLAEERRIHSQGRVPIEWEDIATNASTNGNEVASTPIASAGMKRTHSQANSENNSRPKAAVHPAVSEFERFSNREIKAEQARQAKRRKRNESKAEAEKAATEAADEEAAQQAALDIEKKGTKKERKNEASKMTEREQHVNTNEAARLATANIFGRLASSKKKKEYSWMTGVSGGGSKPASGASTPARAAPAAPATPKQPEVKKGPRIGQFDEKSEPGIQARDLVLVLESDGKAARSFVKASSIIDGGSSA